METDQEAGDGDRLKQALSEHFGFDELRPGQEAVIRSLMDGFSAAAVFPTGGGKSLCYQLPALLLPGLTLVVSPLIALMKDQIDQLQSKGISAARLDSSLTWDQHRQVMNDVRSGELKLLYVAPERFNNERFRESLKHQRIALMAIDEAHCISEWGHNFRPDYLKLAGFSRMCRAERVLALTATAPPKVLDDIQEGFDIQLEHSVRTGFFRENLILLATEVTAEHRDEALMERLREREAGSTIVYVTLQKTAEEVAEKLAAHGFDATAYHAGLDPEQRAQIQDAFFASDQAVVVATIAFGMGVDKPNIRYVYHYNPPKSLENLAQEIGRAGRDGEQAICEQLICTDDLNTIRNFACGDTPSLGAIRAFLEFLFRNEASPVALGLHSTAAEFDIRQLVLRTLLTYLELEGYAQAETPYYASYRFKPLASSTEILSGFQGERRQFLRDLLRQSTKRRTWFDIDLDRSALKLQQDRGRLVRALDYLAENGWLELKPADIRFPFRVLKPDTDLDALAKVLHGRMTDLEQRELARLQQVLDLAKLEGCRWHSLCNYFGETRDFDCDACSWCFEGEALSLEEPPPRSLDDEVWSRVLELVERTEALQSPRALARFLVGLSSPRASKARLGREELFGVAFDIPFQDVLEQSRARLA